jgi:hypothetical protein
VFKGIESWRDLIGAHERATFDAKKDYAAGNNKPFEMAKDVAAFASGVGGSLVVGAVEGTNDQEGQIVQLESISNPGELIKTISSAVKAHCRPMPVFDAITLNVQPSEAGQILGRAVNATFTVVVVNVQPHPLGPVAIRVPGADGKPIDGAFRFPNRVGEQGEYMQPERLAMVWGTHERKIAVQLSEMQRDQSRNAHNSVAIIDDAFSSDKIRPEAWLVEGIDFAGMSIDVRPTHSGHSGAPRIPFTFIRAVWNEPSGRGWLARVAGWLTPDANGTVFFVPS